MLYYANLDVLREDGFRAPGGAARGEVPRPLARQNSCIGAYFSGVGLPVGSGTRSCPRGAWAKGSQETTGESVTMAEILVVEDNSAVRMAYRLLLKAAGHGVTEAADGDEAIAKLGVGTFDLVITDLWMPGTDGFQVIAEAKRRSPQTPVLAVTGGAVGGASSRDPARRATEAGADAVIEKPMLGEGMLSAVNALIGRPLPAGQGGGEGA